MTALKGCIVILGLATVAMFVLFNFAGREELSENVTAVQEVQTATDNLFLIPTSFAGGYDAMWSPLRNSPDLLLPITAESKLRGEIQVDRELRLKVIRTDGLRVKQKFHGKPVIFLAVYTDANLIKAGITFIRVKPEEVLKEALFSPIVAGICFNPKSRVCDEERYAWGVDRIRITSLIGYLQRPDYVPTGSYHALANQAAAEKKWYLSQYYWVMSREEGRPGDDWTQAEINRLRGWVELGFPQAREYAGKELEWFTRKYGNSTDADELRKVLAEAPGIPH